MDQISQYVFQALSTGDTVVFPSESSARYWQIAYARKYGVCFSDRCLAADRFFELFHTPCRNAVKATVSLRYLFMEQFSLPLPYFLSVPDESVPSVLGYLSSLLPSLRDFSESEELEGVDPLMKEDCMTLYREYRTFLDEHGFYEPRYLDYNLSQVEGRFRVLFPDATLGFSSLYEKLGSPEWIISCPMPRPAEKKVIGYADHVDEITGCLNQVRQLLCQGVPARDIIISVAREETMIARLKDEAWRYSVPLVIRNGEQPLEHAAGQLFEGVKELWESSFLFASMESFLLDIRLPWKDRMENREIIREGVKRCIDQGDQDEKKNPWVQKCRGEIKKRTGSLCFFVAGMNRAQNAVQFRKAFRGFQDKFLDPGLFSESEKEVAGICFDEIDRLEREMAQANVTKTRFLDLLLRSLKDKRYVSRQQDKRGVQVFRWTDSNTMAVPYHFVLSIDLEGAVCVNSPLSFLSNSVDELSGEEDLSEQNLECAALVSSRISFHERDYEGERLPPSGFEVVEADKKTGDPFDDEYKLFVSGSGDGELFSAAQKAGGVYAFSHALRVVESGSFPGEAPRNVSATSLDRFTGCPYNYALTYILGLREERYNCDLIDYAAIGVAVHSGFEKFFNGRGPLLPQQREQDEKLLRELLGRELETALSSQAVTPFVKRWIETRYVEQSLAALDEPASKDDSVVKRKTEYSVNNRLWPSVENASLVVEGKIDRVDYLSDGTVSILDYKSGKAPLSIFSKTIPTLQLFLYSLLVEEEVSEAWYFSVKEKAYKQVWNPGTKEKEKGVFLKGSDKLISQLSKLDDAIGENRFPAEPEDVKNCSGCEFRAVCRKRFSIR